MTELEMIMKMFDRLGEWYEYDKDRKILFFGSYEGVELHFDENGNAIKMY